MVQRKKPIAARVALLVGVAALALIALTASPAMAGKPVASYTLTLSCPASTYGYITNVVLYDKNGNAVSGPSAFALECHTSPPFSTPLGYPATIGPIYTSAKAASWGAGFWWCEDNRNSAGILGGTFLNGTFPLAKGRGPTTASCGNVPDITLTIS